MEQIVPWAELEALVEPHYLKAGNGCRPVGLSIMLRTYFMQQWFDLSDPGSKEDVLRVGDAAPVCWRGPRRGTGAG